MGRLGERIGEVNWEEDTCNGVKGKRFFWKIVNFCTNVLNAKL